MTGQSVWRGEAIDDHPPELYAIEQEADYVEGGFDALTEADYEAYRERGYLALRNAFNAREVQDAIDAMDDMVMGRNTAFNEAKVLQFEADAAVPEGEGRYGALRKLAYFVQYDERFMALVNHPSLHTVLRRLLGGAATLHQDMAFVKAPGIGSEKPWHQDLAYFNLEAGAPVVGVWIALDQADRENGCMHVIPGSHRGGPVVHFRRRDWQLCDTDVDVPRGAVVPLPPGGCLIFDGLLHHGTPSNRSPKLRRAMQFHYAPASAKKVDDEARMAIFGPEGKDVEC